jgi:hypothetical protein
MRLRISIALAAAVAAIAVLVIGVGSAAAGNKGPKGPPDPQTTNIPYVAWIGETVKASVCFGYADTVTEASAQSALGGSDLLPAGTATVTDWSGVTDEKPQVISQPWGQLTNSGICFSFDIYSEKPGLADVLLSLNNNFLTLLLGGDSLYQHAFKVIWLQDQAPVINEVAGDNLGDPTGNGVFNPIPQGDGTNAFEPGQIHILVKGTFPLGNDFAGLGHPVVTLPDDWAWLADNFATDGSAIGSGTGSAAAMRWDIHDDDLTTEGHTSGSFCTDQVDPSLTVDAVDNCEGGGDLGPFSNIYGGSSDYAVGPFDPIRPADTLLSDGKLDAGDAPMPALRVDVNLSADSTVGTLSKVDKTDIYIRDASKSPDTAHNLYAPFYEAFIPAALPGEGSIISNGPATSGVAGHASDNNASFLGFDSLGTTEETPGLYDYWDTFNLTYSHGYNDCKDASGNWIPLPHGATSVAVYTDEHGEAYVQYNPYPGIVLTPDSDGRCDIYDTTNPTVGHSTITANAVYPDQIPNWDHGLKTSNPLTKTVNYDSSKILNCVPKSTDEAFCVETILDPQGNPVYGAKVEFSAQSFTGSEPLIRASAHVVGSYDTTKQGRDTSNVNNRVDITTGPNGEAAIDVVSTTGSCIDVVAENVGTRNGGTGIFRSTDFNPTSGTSCGGTTPPPTGTPGGSQGSTSGSGGAPAGAGTSTAPVVTAAPVAVSAPVPTARTAPAAKTTVMTLASARVVKVKVGKHSTVRYLMVRVNGAAKSAKLKITLVSKNGHSVVTRYVATNRQVRVGNLKLAPTIRSVRVALA